jgi:hypothetical protein
VIAQIGQARLPRVPRIGITACLDAGTPAMAARVTKLYGAP